MSRTRKEEDPFKRFFEEWIAEQERQLHELMAASHAHINEKTLRSLIERVMAHYEAYYDAKSKAAKENIVGMFSPTWTSKLENAFLWIAGWRPAMVFRLLYAKAGLQLDSDLADLLQGLSRRNLADLSPSQLMAVNELQMKTIKEEEEISRKMAKLQEGVADQPLVGLVQMVNAEEDGVEAALEEQEEGLERVLECADRLRLETLKSVVGVLNLIQAVDLLVAAAQLHLKIHEWGMKRDGNLNHHDLTAAPETGKP
ncbi:hypothetical protein AMTRI_Chr01g110430 [Amborella trichopoda]|uniref:DOG1 domain-containing protein n=1 Tax=Amborella trichopoda TaxID=13333 RepID=W1NRP8_AMBTC|nr:protein DOG1-like 4 [Amborella trichopoda]ERM97680.1 hypothetical protein AMTR_s00130p00113960 [Amborella trichopoda]|eukprot:XP_006830264.1 protein DOG1-like 4 [Amborella trichopoda]